MSSMPGAEAKSEARVLMSCRTARRRYRSRPLARPSAHPRLRVALRGLPSSHHVARRRRPTISASCPRIAPQWDLGESQCAPCHSSTGPPHPAQGSHLKNDPVDGIKVEAVTRQIWFKDDYALLRFFNISHLASNATGKRYLATSKREEAALPAPPSGAPAGRQEARR